MRVFLGQETRRRMQYENKTRAENNAIFVARDCLVEATFLKSRCQTRYLVVGSRNSEKIVVLFIPRRFNRCLLCLRETNQIALR